MATPRMTYGFFVPNASDAIGYIPVHMIQLNIPIVFSAAVYAASTWLSSIISRLRPDLTSTPHATQIFDLGGSSFLQEGQTGFGLLDAVSAGDVCGLDSSSSSLNSAGALASLFAA